MVHHIFVTQMKVSGESFCSSPVSECVSLRFDVFPAFMIWLCFFLHFNAFKTDENILQYNYLKSETGELTQEWSG